MSQLTQMRHRIRAIQTIKKITHAMRLISMSTHSRMKHMQEPLELYQKSIATLLKQAHKAYPSYHNTILNPIEKAHHKTLVILVGSQKGLCGGFNTSLFQLFNKKEKESPSSSIITVGKRATNFIQKNRPENLIAFYNNFGLHNAQTISESLLHEIIQHSYSSVIMYGNTAPSFFSQKPIELQIIPSIQTEDAAPDIFYEWEQSAQEILSFLSEKYILSQIENALFQSLLAEHAARFISMDSSTRNAEQLLERMQRDYNKLRQAKITRELTELSSFFLS